MQWQCAGDRRASKSGRCVPPLACFDAHRLRQDSGVDARSALRRLERAPGATVQIGASIMFALGRLAPHCQGGFMLAGSAAGVAAAFNTPFAGIVFGIAELSRWFVQRTSTIVIGTVIAAGLT